MQASSLLTACARAAVCGGLGFGLGFVCCSGLGPPHTLGLNSTPNLNRTSPASPRLPPGRRQLRGHQDTAAAMASATGGTSLRDAVVIDWANDSPAEKRRKIGAALANTLGPMFFIKNYGFEPLRAEVFERVKATHAAEINAHRDQGCSGQISFTLRPEKDGMPLPVHDDGLTDRFEAAVRAFALDVSAAVLLHHHAAADPDPGTAAVGSGVTPEAAALQAMLDAGNQQIGGNLSVRCYPHRPRADRESRPNVDADADDAVMLGAHVDANIFTLLWRDYSSSPTSDSCLQVPHPDRNPTLTADTIRKMGMPMCVCVFSVLYVHADVMCTLASVPRGRGSRGSLPPATRSLSGVPNDSRPFCCPGAGGGAVA